MWAESRRPIILGQAIILGVLTGFYLLSIGVWSAHPASSDFAKFHASSRFFLEGKNIYSPVPIDAFGPPLESAKVFRETLHPNLNPPFLTLLLAPLGSLEYHVAFWIWSVLLLLCGIAGISLIQHATASTDGIERALRYSILLLAYFPTWASIVYGQLSLLLLLLIVIAWTASHLRKDQVAGIALGLAFSLKIFTGLFLIFFLLRRRWRLLAWLVATFLFCWLVALLVLGPDAYRQWLAVLGSVTWYAASWNASFMGFLTRIFGGSGNTPLFNLPGLAYGLTAALSLLALACLTWMARPWAAGVPAERFDLGFSFTTVAMLLISPLGWMYYFPLLTLPMLLAWRMAHAKSHKTAILLAWLLTTVPRELMPAAKLNEPTVWFTWAGLYFYGLLILGTMLALLARSLHPAAQGKGMTRATAQRAWG